jgi:hypothetical protein
MSWSEARQLGREADLGRACLERPTFTEILAVALGTITTLTVPLVISPTDKLRRFTLSRPFLYISIESDTSCFAYLHITRMLLRHVQSFPLNLRE